MMVSSIRPNGLFGWLLGEVYACLMLGQVIPNEEKLVLLKKKTLLSLAGNSRQEMLPTSDSSHIIINAT
jgi:hypothetical protein